MLSVAFLCSAVGRADLPPDLAEFAVQALQLGGRLLQVAFLGLQVRDLVDQRLPVDLSEIGRLVEAGQDLGAIVGPRRLLLDASFPWQQARFSWSWIALARRSRALILRSLAHPST